MSSTARPTEFIALTSLRGVAALGVVYFHSYIYFWNYATPHDWTCPKFYLWVDFFLVLSGFVMAHAYGDKLRASGSAPLAEFALARIARVYPLHLLMLCVMMVIEAVRWRMAAAGIDPLQRPAFSGPTEWRALPYNLLLVHAWNLLPRLTWNVPSWSISAEAACYLAFPLLVRSGLDRQRWSTALLALVSLGGLAVLDHRYGGLNQTFHNSVLRCLPEFILGWLVYRAAHSRMAESLPPLLREALPWLVCALVIAGFACDADDFVMACGFVLLVYAYAANGTRAARLMAARPLHWLGDISYSVYLTHHALLLALMLWLGASHDPLREWACAHPVVLIAGAMLLVIGCSHVSYRAVEKPAQRWLRGLRGRRAAPLAAAPAQSQA
ncbi:MAG TPA: acyltransferase [Nevskiaceae bacterium]|nr:acyltransferase [Nevskiaceae bacterium]